MDFEILSDRCARGGADDRFRGRIGWQCLCAERSGASMIRHLLCVMLCAALLLLPAAGRANPGDLDPTFGIGGKVTTGIGTDDYGYAVAIQADGKIVVAGDTIDGGNNDDALVHDNAEGRRDAALGAGG